MIVSYILFAMILIHLASRQDIKATQSIIGNGVKTLSYLALVLIADL
jgi:hypothetical protein